MKDFIGKDANGTKWERISKQQAFKNLLAGEVVGVLPSNMNPSSFWNIPNEWNLASIINLHSYSWDENKPDDKVCFERACNSYKYYNCNAETGRTIAFFRRLAA